ncbi:MAG: hypothetical protein A3E77_17640 [Sphingopyxis sp. RIFCSPHIGHO2_12_FULL_65_19]|nr:MAG: hypothetical protein A3E77_17640 [Sphingopyxis sp. RIFCSPHIGHO2_12_FULL_65_19]
MGRHRQRPILVDLAPILVDLALRRTKKGAALPQRPFHDQDPERETVLLDTVALHPLALHLAGAADGGSMLARTLFAGLLVVTTQLHFAIHALTLQLLLERAKGLVDIIVANDDLHTPCRLLFVKTICATGQPGLP